MCIAGDHTLSFLDDKINMHKYDTTNAIINMRSNTYNMCGNTKYSSRRTHTT